MINKITAGICGNLFYVDINQYAILFDRACLNEYFHSAT